jgi:hypothetical protein
MWCCNSPRWTRYLIWTTCEPLCASIRRYAPLCAMSFSRKRSLRSASSAAITVWKSAFKQAPRPLSFWSAQVEAPRGSGAVRALWPWPFWDRTPRWRFFISGCYRARKRTPHRCPGRAATAPPASFPGSGQEWTFVVRPPRGPLHRSGRESIRSCAVGMAHAGCEKQRSG